MSDRIVLTRGKFAAVVAAVLVVGGAFGAVVSTDPAAPSTEDPQNDDEAPGVAAFESADDFRAYVREGQRAAGGHTLLAGGAAGADGGVQVERAEGDAGGARPQPTGTPAATAAPEAQSADVGAGGSGGGASEPRSSDTNVQVAGLDEPDVLKTTSDTLYYAGQRGRYRPHGDRAGARGVHLINASDPAAPEVASRIDASGRLLLAGDTLLVLEGDSLTGYDVSDRENPEQVWTKTVPSRVVTARLYAGHVYLVTAEGVDRDDPCPVRPMEGVSVDCTGIHHPREPVPVDTTYAVTVLNPADGSVDDSTGFVGARGRSVVYMSADTVYVTYQKPADRTDVLLDFLLENQSDRFDEATLEHLREVRSYDLSQRAKRVEVMATIQRWQAGLDDDERREVMREFREDMRAYAEAHKRDFEQTGVVAIDVENPQSDAPSVEPGATGAVPGRPLNQFSLDQHEGNLRIATTVGGEMGADSANDVYVLDESLDVVGAVKGMGVTERIYSVRFRGDEAYVVTFRRVDPFHVLDLSDPTDPTMEGELKLPGFSSYLHPLGEDRVLGIGEEDGRVKLVVFDVSDPTDPTIEESKILDARWSAVSESHHAFLMDRKHGVFFLPARDGGHVFSYEDGLERVTTVDTEGPARRAAYVGDYLYVFGDRSLTVVDERTWNRTVTVDLREEVDVWTPTATPVADEGADGGDVESPTARPRTPTPG